MSEKETNNKKTIYLSSSRIDTLSTCSWTYYCKYVLKLPDTSNDGARRGSACHDLLECLCSEKRWDFVLKISKSVNDIKNNKLINRFLRRKYKQLGLEPNNPIDKRSKKTNHELVIEMLHTALSLEFIKNHKKRNIIHSEYEFNFVNEKPRYALRGFIDRVAEIEGEDGEKHLEILDYKSSKAKFKGEKAEANLQGMIYTLVAKKKWENYKKYVANFFFMRFPKDPYLKNEFDDNQLAGLEHYLEYITEQLEAFDEKSAISNMAAHDNERSWLCGRGSWVCPFKHSFDFFQIVKEKDNSVVAGSYTYGEAEKWIEDNAGGNKNEFKIEMKRYEGCPAWKKDLTFE